MKVLYKNDYVKELFDDLNNMTTSKKKMQNIISMDLLRTIKKRYSQLIASPNFNFIVEKHIGKCESLSGDMKGKYSIVLSANYRLIICPNSESLDPKKLKECDEFFIEGVVDYHGSKQKWIIP